MSLLDEARARLDRLIAAAEAERLRRWTGLGTDEGAEDMSTYEADFAAWAQSQALSLRAKDWPALEVDHLAEEIEALARSEERALVSYFEVLVQHLLKWTAQPGRRGQSWRRSIRVSRQRIARIVRRNPQLSAQLESLLAEAYPDARENAADETGLGLERFPERCPWDVADVLNQAFWPEGLP